MSEAAKVLPFPRCDDFRCPMEPEITRQKQVVIDLDARLTRQDGSLYRIEAKVDGLIQRFDDKKDAIHWWIISFLGAALFAALSAVAYLLRSKPA
jgi:hypothetical protein